MHAYLWASSCLRTTNFSNTHKLIFHFDINSCKCVLKVHKQIGTTVLVVKKRLCVNKHSSYTCMVFSFFGSLLISHTIVILLNVAARKIEVV